MYGNITDWRAYALARGNSAPTDATDADATAALTRASDMIRVRYVPNLILGYGVDFTPDGSDLPIVEEASYIAASLELATPGLFSKTYTEAEKKVLTGVDKIRWTVVGNASGTYAAMPVSTLVEALFDPYIIDPDEAGFMLRSVGGRCV